MARRRTSNYRPVDARKDARKGRRFRVPRVRRELAILGAIGLAVVIGLGALGVAALQSKIDRDWATVATVNGHDISRESLRGRVTLVEFLAKERDFFLGRSVGSVGAEQLPGLRAQAAAPLADVANAAREQLIDEELVRELAAREGVGTPTSPDPWAEARAYISSDLARQIRLVRFGLAPASGSASAAPGSASAASPSSPASSPAASAWPTASEANRNATVDRVRAEFAAGTKIETIVAGLHDAGWTVFGEDVAVSSDGVPADASLQLDPEMAAGALAGQAGTIVGPATDEYGRVSLALLLRPADTTILMNLLGPDATEMKVDPAALADWADAQALRRVLSTELLDRWKTQGVLQAHFRELVIGDSPDSTGAAGPWVELSGLALDRLASVDPAVVASAPPGLDLSAGKLVETLRSMPAADRAALFERLVAAANAASGGSGTSGEIGYVSKDGLVEDVGKAAFDSNVKSGDVLGPIATSAGPQLFLVEARYGGALDDRSKAALQIVRADPSADPLAYTTRFSAADVALAKDAGWRAEAEFGSDEDVRAALFDTPIGELSGPFTLDGKLACAVVDERTTGLPDARTTARLTLDGYAAWFHSEKIKATITRAEHPLPELEPSASPSPSAFCSQLSCARNAGPADDPGFAACHPGQDGRNGAAGAAVGAGGPGT